MSEKEERLEIMKKIDFNDMDIDSQNKMIHFIGEMLSEHEKWIRQALDNNEENAHDIKVNIDKIRILEENLKDIAEKGIAKYLVYKKKDNTEALMPSGSGVRDIINHEIKLRNLELALTELSEDIMSGELFKQPYTIGKKLNNKLSGDKPAEPSPACKTCIKKRETVEICGVYRKKCPYHKSEPNDDLDDKLLLIEKAEIIQIIEIYDNGHQNEFEPKEYFAHISNELIADFFKDFDIDFLLAICKIALEKMGRPIDEMRYKKIKENKKKWQKRLKK